MFSTPSLRGRDHHRGLQNITTIIGLEQALSSRLYSVPTISSLTAIRKGDLPDQKLVFVEAYWDGIPAPHFRRWIADSENDDGGYAYLPSDDNGVGRWEIEGPEPDLKAFGARGDLTGDDAPPFNADIAWNIAQGLGGRLPASDGSYLLLSRIDVEGDGIFDGAGINIDGESASSTVFFIHHNDGPGVKFSRSFCQLNNCQVQGTSTRKNGSTTDSDGLPNVGVLLYEGANDFTTKDVRSQGHPSHGWMLVGSAHRAKCYGVIATLNKGHGVYISPGQDYGLASGNTPGLVTIDHLTCNNNGGHALCAGVESGVGTLSALRVIVNQFDGAGNASDAAVRRSLHEFWGRGVDCEITGGAYSGSDTHYGIAWGGENNFLLNNRFFSMLGDTKCIDVLSLSGATRTMTIDGVEVDTTTGVVATAVVVESGVDMDSIHVRNVSGCTAAVSPATALKPEPYTLAQAGASAAHTGGTSETTIASVTMPATAPGTNGRTVIEAAFSYTNDADNKTMLVKVGGVTVFTTTQTTSQFLKVVIEIANRNSAGSQLVTTTTYIGSTVAVAKSTVTMDTSVDADILIRGTLADGADTITLEGWSAVIFPDG